MMLECLYKYSFSFETLTPACAAKLIAKSKFFPLIEILFISEFYGRKIFLN